MFSVLGLSISKNTAIFAGNMKEYPMKKALFTRIFVFAFAMCGLGFGTLQAQDCEAYYPIKTGASWELTHYDAKGKVGSMTQTSVTDVQSNNGETVLQFHALTLDAKGRELTKHDFDASCSNGEFKVDMTAVSGSTSTMPAVEGLELKIESTDMVFPGQLTVGQSLPDASMHMTGTMNGMTIMNNTTSVTNRKVTGKEKVTTPAGTFDCVVIEEDVKMSGAMGMNMEVHTKSWYALHTGMVKTESTRNGKSNGSSVLTKFSGN
jgi:hypothetical protein